LKLDIRKKDKQVFFKQLWMAEQYNKLKLDPEIMAAYSKEEIRAYLEDAYSKRHISNGRLYNNVDHSNQILTQEQFINYYLNLPYVLTDYATFYKTQKDCVNISAKALETLGKLRKVNKKKMEAAEHGSDEYIYYRILQLTYKVLMNSYYGILGEKNSIFYNPYVQNSTTKSGQTLITTAIEAMEAFLANNVPFEDTDDILTFIYNIKNEDQSESILSYVDAPVSKNELKAYLLEHSRDHGAKVDQGILDEVLAALDMEMLTRCYYKNNILAFLLKNSWCTSRLKEMLKYTYAESPDEAMKPILDTLRDKVMSFVFYDNLYEDRYKRAMKDMRGAIITIDTDSVFSNVNPHMMSINAALGLDKSNEEQQTTLMNILINIVTEALRRTMWTLTTNMGLIDEAKPTINLKQEFAYKRILLTQNKKNYAGIITAELGHLLEKPVLDIKGLPILKKTSVPKTLRKQFTEIVENDILKTPVIDLKKILDKYDSIEEQIEVSLRDRKVEYLLPKNLELIENYKTPEQIEAVRGTLIWNALEPENQIIPPAKINLLKLDCTDPNDPRLEALSKTHPQKYAALMKAVFNYNETNVKVDISRFGFSCIAIPKSIETLPEYLLPFIDYKSMTNTNMSASYILLESLGIYTTEAKTIQYKSNIISI